jgi:hypothetical protein
MFIANMIELDLLLDCELYGGVMATMQSELLS